MKLATQEQVDKFIADGYMNPDIYPYLSVCQYVRKKTVADDDWGGVILTNDTGTCLLFLHVDRAMGNDMSVSLYAHNPFAAGRCVETIRWFAGRYKARAITACVHATNETSLRFVKRFLGEPWGIEPAGAWDAHWGQWVDLHHFRLKWIE